MFRIMFLIGCFVLVSSCRTSGTGGPISVDDTPNKLRSLDQINASRGLERDCEFGVGVDGTTGKFQSCADPLCRYNTKTGKCEVDVVCNDNFIDTNLTLVIRTNDGKVTSVEGSGMPYDQKIPILVNMGQAGVRWIPFPSGSSKTGSLFLTGKGTIEQIIKDNPEILPTKNDISEIQLSLSGQGMVDIGDSSYWSKCKFNTKTVQDLINNAKN
jgi:hypothetical protein